VSGIDFVSIFNTRMIWNGIPVNGWSGYGTWKKREYRAGLKTGAPRRGKERRVYQ
jgi:hypothetical protein